MKCAAAYLRVAHIYMLISMPTDTSTIFGAFQAISAFPLLPGELRPCRLRYCGSKSSPAKSFAWNPHLFMLHRKEISRGCVKVLGQNDVGSSYSRLLAPPRMAILGDGALPAPDKKHVKNRDGLRLRGLHRSQVSADAAILLQHPYRR